MNELMPGASPSLCHWFFIGAPSFAGFSRFQCLFNRIFDLFTMELSHFSLVVEGFLFFPGVNGFFFPRH